MNDSLLRAYETTDYIVFADPPVTIRIGVHDRAVVALLAARHVATAAFLTAWNPFSRPTGMADNARAQKRLVAELSAMGVGWIPGEGRGPDPAWPPEASLLILGITRAEADRLRAAFEQAAYVWLERDRAPELVLMPTLP